MATSEQTDKLDAALTKAQAEFKSARFDKVNPHYKNKYASLTSVIDATRHALVENGISVTQATAWRDGVLFVVTRLAHAGQWISGEWPVEKGKPQEMGSAYTYARRYGLSGITCISADEDDDAEATRKSNGALITAEQVNELYKIALEKKVEIKKLLELTHCERVGDISASVFERAKSWSEKHP